MRDLCSVLRPDYRFMWPQVDWWDDQDFNRYLGRFGETNGMNCDRRWMVHQLIKLVDTVEGDTAECGVFSGSTSYVICQANQAATVAAKTHHMFDSFAGLSEPVPADGDHWTRGDLAYSLAAAQRNLDDFEKVAFYPGWIPSRFHEVDGKTFSFVHIDVDLYEPTKASIEFFYSRMAMGGVIVVDDYGQTTCPGATSAVDEILEGKPEQMLRLSAGGGFIIRGIQTVRPARSFELARAA